MRRSRSTAAATSDGSLAGRSPASSQAIRVSRRNQVMLALGVLARMTGRDLDGLLHAPLPRQDAHRLAIAVAGHRRQVWSVAGGKQDAHLVQQSVVGTSPRVRSSMRRSSDCARPPDAEHGHAAGLRGGAGPPAPPPPASSRSSARSTRRGLRRSVAAAVPGEPGGAAARRAPPGPGLHLLDQPRAARRVTTAVRRGHSRRPGR